MMEITVKGWKFETTEEGKQKIAGNYSVMLGTKEVAKATFNGGYGTTDIVFSKEVMDKIKEISNQVTQEILESFN
jgi:hypothetical protein